MEIKLVQLVSGDSVISEIQQCNNNEVVLVDPHVIMPAEGGLALVPWPLGAGTNEISVQKEHIVYVVEPNEQIANGYKQKTDKGILTSGGLIR